MAVSRPSDLVGGGGLRANGGARATGGVKGTRKVVNKKAVVKKTAAKKSGSSTSKVKKVNRVRVGVEGEDGYGNPSVESFTLRRTAAKTNSKAAKEISTPKARRSLSKLIQNDVWVSGIAKPKIQKGYKFQTDYFDYYGRRYPTKFIKTKSGSRIKSRRTKGD